MAKQDRSETNGTSERAVRRVLRRNNIGSGASQTLQRLVERRNGMPLLLAKHSRFLRRRTDTVREAIQRTTQRTDQPFGAEMSYKPIPCSSFWQQDVVRLVQRVRPARTGTTTKRASRNKFTVQDLLVPRSTVTLAQGQLLSPRAGGSLTRSHVGSCAG